MLIGQIEQEILEGNFWYFWLYCHSNTNSTRDDLIDNLNKEGTALQLNYPEICCDVQDHGD